MAFCTTWKEGWATNAEFNPHQSVVSFAVVEIQGEQTHVAALNG